MTTTWIGRDKTIDDEIAQIQADLADVGRLLAGYELLRNKPVWTGNDVAYALEEGGHSLEYLSGLISTLREQGNSPLHDSDELKKCLLPSIERLVSAYKGHVRSFEYLIECLERANWK